MVKRRKRDPFGGLYGVFSLQYAFRRQYLLRNVRWKAQTSKGSTFLPHLELLNH